VETVLRRLLLIQRADQLLNGNVKVLTAAQIRELAQPQEELFLLTMFQFIATPKDRLTALVVEELQVMLLAIRVFQDQCAVLVMEQ
jgi:hypothetical protein